MNFRLIFKIIASGRQACALLKPTIAVLTQYLLFFAIFWVSNVVFFMRLLCAFNSQLVDPFAFRFCCCFFVLRSLLLCHTTCFLTLFIVIACSHYLPMLLNMFLLFHWILIIVDPKIEINISFFFASVCTNVRKSHLQSKIF